MSKEPLTQETITTVQAKDVRATLESGFAYLSRLVRRMDKTFKPTDPLFRNRRRLVQRVGSVYGARCERGEVMRVAI